MFLETESMPRQRVDAEEVLNSTNAINFDLIIVLFKFRNGYVKEPDNVESVA